MLTEYINAAMERAEFELLDGDEGYFGQIPPCQGVGANESSLVATRRELRSALEDWIMAHFRDGTPLPEIQACSRAS